MVYFRRVFLLLFWLTGSPPLLAAELQSHDSIRQAASAHALANYTEADKGISVKVTRLDRRLRLNRCDEPLETFSSPGGSNKFKQTVGVRCPGTSPWSIYVPVSIKLKMKIVIANRELARGTLITAGDIRLEEREVSLLRRGFFEQPERLIGMHLKKSLREKDVISPRQLTAPQTIKRGSQVTILGQVGSLKVRMEGKALADGAVGQRIKVQNKSSNRRIEAMVIAPGIVEVSL